mmetsp:Transcript_11821/g.14702  ORF Transcript_11821/g.14702 Transcript_11821/m.14702 type:complete len:94 (+) Transcript_11821:150-431(+)
MEIDYVSPDDSSLPSQQQGRTTTKTAIQQRLTGRRKESSPPPSSKSKSKWRGGGMRKNYKSDGMEVLEGEENVTHKDFFHGCIVDDFDLSDLK